MKIGKILTISNMSVSILLEVREVAKRDAIYVEHEGGKVFFEVAYVEGSIAKAIPMGPVYGLTKGMDAYLKPGGIRIEYSDNVLGHVFGAFGDPIDGTVIENPVTKNIYEKNLSMAEINEQGEILKTGIKALDFFAPMQKGYKMGLLGADYSFSTAVGLFNSVINFILLISVNKISKKVSETSLW